MENSVHDEWRRRQRRWLRFVEDVERSFASGQNIETGPLRLPMQAPGEESPASQAKVVICSPHPDDESLTGALALRFRLEMGISVLNVAITLGSKPAERNRRLREGESSCGALGFRLKVANYPNGLDSVTLQGREDSTSWARKVSGLLEIFAAEQPTVVFLPHEEDFNATHVGTHHLVLDALRDHMCNPSRWPIMLIETEYWRELPNPNLMVGISAEMEAMLVMATAEHRGEVARNPYHISHPARMINNVRRGAEVVGQMGGPSVNFQFAELYRVSFVDERGITHPWQHRLILDPTESADPSKIAAYFSIPR